MPLTLTVSVPLQVADARVQYVGARRPDGTHLVVFLNALGEPTSGVAAEHDVRAYHAAIAELDARLAAQETD